MPHPRTRLSTCSQGGQGVFGIALGRVWQEVEGNLAELPAVRAEDGLLTVGQDKRHPDA